MAPGNRKHYCTECGWAAKTACPVHPGMSMDMGTRWRPGKKGSRERLWSLRSTRNRQMPPAKRRYHAWYGVPKFIQELGVAEPKETAEQYWFARIGNAVQEDIRVRGLKQRQRRRRNRE